MIYVEEPLTDLGFPMVFVWGPTLSHNHRSKLSLSLITPTCRGNGQIQKSHQSVRRAVVRHQYCVDLWGKRSLRYGTIWRARSLQWFTVVFGCRINQGEINKYHRFARYEGYISKLLAYNHTQTCLYTGSCKVQLNLNKVCIQMTQSLL
jgi:hypothetical protein